MSVPRSFTIRLCLSAVLLWLGLRLLALFLKTTLAPLPLGVAFFPLLVVVAKRLQLRRSGERILYANLGVSPTYVSSWVLAVAVGLELTLAVALSF